MNFKTPTIPWVPLKISVETLMERDGSDGNFPEKVIHLQRSEHELALLINQSDRQANSSRRHKGREKSCFSNDWFSKWRETCKPIKKSSYANQMLRGRPFDF